MGYNKMVSYGDVVETYAYEKFFGNSVQGGHGRRNGGSGVASVRAPGDAEAQKAAHVSRRKDNAGRAAVAFRRLVGANLGGSERPLLLTLTYKENMCSLRDAYRDFSLFISSLRYQFGSAFRYVSVAEFQERGAVHFHALFWGLPSSVFREQFVPGVVARTWGHGHLFVKMTDGDARLSGYLSKYMVKTFIDPRLRGIKAYTCSRNLKRPVILVGFETWWVIEDDWLVDKSLVESRSYATMYLGRCDYKKYSS